MKIIPLSRALVGLAVAPIAPGIFAAVAESFLPGVGVGASFFIGIAAVAGYPVALLVGLPIHILCERRGWTDLSHYFAFGIVMGIVAYFGAYLHIAVRGLLRGAEGWADGYGDAVFSTIILLPLSAGAGGIAGATFWLIALKKFKSSAAKA